MDCDYRAEAETTEELLAQVVEHARDVHGITEITPELQAKVASVIKET
jgi:predicted small metal-binding protein